MKQFDLKLSESRLKYKTRRKNVTELISKKLGLKQHELVKYFQLVEVVRLLVRNRFKN